MSRFKFITSILVLLIAIVIMPKNTFALTAQELAAKITPDGTTATLKCKKPSDAEEADALLSSILTRMIGDSKYYSYGTYDDSNGTLSFAIIDTEVEGPEAQIYSGTVDVTFTEPSDATKKAIADNYVDKLKKIQGWGIDINSFYVLTDLALINYLKSSDKSELWHPGAGVRALKFVPEFNKDSDASNLNIELEVRMGAQEENLMYEFAAGFASIYFDDELYGIVDPVGLYTRRVIYIPESTDNSKEAYIDAAQKRINDYLGDTSVEVSYGGLLSSLDDEAEDQENPVEGSDGNYYNIKVGTRTYKFYIVKGTSEDLVEPTYKGMDYTSKIEVTSDESSIPLDTTVTVSEVKDATIKDKINTENYVSYDIILFSDYKNAKIEKLNNGEFLVKIPVPDTLAGKTLTVYYITSTGEKEEHEATLSEDKKYVTFKTDHFSVYTVAEKTVTYSVTFDTDGGSSIDKQEIVSGGKITRPANDPKKEGFEFVDWYTDKNCNLKFDFSSSITTNTVVYAKWTKSKEQIKNINLIVSSPVAGEEVKKIKKTDEFGTYDWHDKEPSIILEDNAEYTIAGTYYISSYPSIKPDGYDEPFYGVFEENKEYYIELYLIPKDGYEFASTLDVKLNGATSYEVSKYNSANNFIVYLTAKAENNQDYKVLEGQNQTVNTKKTDEITFRVNIEYDSFVKTGRVYVDGVLVDKSNYTSKEGSTVITFNKKFTSSLSAGDHSLKVAVNNGSAITNFTITKDTSSPQTGDNIMIYIIVLLAAGVGLGTTLILRKKK